MALFGIFTKSGKYLRTTFKGTRKQARKWGNDHYIKGSFKIKELYPKNSFTKGIKKRSKAFK